VGDRVIDAPPKPGVGRENTVTVTINGAVVYMDTAADVTELVDTLTEQLAQLREGANDAGDRRTF
jgi:hypothetical protein